MQNFSLHVQVENLHYNSSHGDLTNSAGAAELGEGVDGGFALAGADDGAVAIVGGMIDVEALALGGPGGAITTEHQVVLDGQLQAGLCELVLDGGEGGEPAAVGEALGRAIGRGEPSRFIKTINGVIEVHGTFPSV